MVDTDHSQFYLGLSKPTCHPFQAQKIEEELTAWELCLFHHLPLVDHQDSSQPHKPATSAKQLTICKSDSWHNQDEEQGKDETKFAFFSNLKKGRKRQAQFWCLSEKSAPRLHVLANQTTISCSWHPTLWESSQHFHCTRVDCQRTRRLGRLAVHVHVTLPRIFRKKTPKKRFFLLHKKWKQ